MKHSNTSVVGFLLERPISVLMTSVAILMLGIVSLFKIPVSLMPNIEVPYITVSIQQEQLSASEMEKSVVTPLRESLMQISNLDDISSEVNSKQGIVSLKFSFGTNIDFAFIEVNEKVDRVMSTLPREIERPRVIKSNASDIPVFYLDVSLKDSTAFDGTKLFPVSQNFLDFNQFTEQVIRKRIEQLQDVSMVDITGLIYKEILVIPNKEKLASLNISTEKLQDVIESTKLDIGNITVRDNQYQYSVNLNSPVATIDQLRSTPIRIENRLFRLHEIAEIILHPKARNGLVLSGNKEALSLAIIKQSDSRMADLKDDLRQLISSFRSEYPDINFEINRDQTLLLEYAIGNLTQSLFWGVLLAFFIMFLFLGDMKSPLVIGITVPTSIISAMLFFQILGISINVISLSGLVLGVGLMVDNAIIVIDNIVQYRVLGFNLKQSCIRGVNEVFRPLLSSSLTTCAVFIPLIFLSGIAGEMFYDQAMAVALTLFTSLLSSFLLVPVLFFIVQNRGSKKSGTKKKSNKIVNLVESGYHLLLLRSLRNQKITWSICLLFPALAVYLFFNLEVSQMPNIEKNETVLEIDWNERLNVEESKERIVDLILPYQERIVSNTSLIGSQQYILNRNSSDVNGAMLYMLFSDQDIMKDVLNQIGSDLTQRFPNSKHHFRDVDNLFNQIFKDDESFLVAKLYPNDTYGLNLKDLGKIWIKLDSVLTNYNLDPLLIEEQIVLDVDINKLTLYNISFDQLYDRLARSFSAKNIYYLNEGQYFLPILIGDNQTIDEVLKTASLLSSESKDEYLISEFVSIRRSSELKNIYSDARGQHIPLHLNIERDQVQDYSESIENIIKTFPFEVQFGGSFFSNQELLEELLSVLVIAVVLLYFILASQFESFLLPVVILMEIPIAIAGSFLFLKIAGASINLMSMIGIIVMTGIIINDSILKIDTIHNLKKSGYSTIRSIFIAGKRRLSPIIMTSLTTILALLPILFFSGIGAELQYPLVWSLMGGMLVGTFVSLYFVPLFYHTIMKS